MVVAGTKQPSTEGVGYGKDSGKKKPSTYSKPKGPDDVDWFFGPDSERNPHAKMPRHLCPPPHPESGEDGAGNESRPSSFGNGDGNWETDMTHSGSMEHNDDGGDVSWFFGVKGGNSQTQSSSHSQSQSYNRTQSHSYSSSSTHVERSESHSG